MDQRTFKRRAEDFLEAYCYDPDFVDVWYEMPALSELASLPGVVGVASFVEFRSFEPERLFTLIYRDRAVEASAVVGETSLWFSLLSALRKVEDNGRRQDEGGQFDAAQAWRRTATLRLPSWRCPRVLRSWEAVCDAAGRAGSCATSTLDGVSYRHQLCSQRFSLVADWRNPDPVDHRDQLALVKAWVTLLRRLRLYPR